MDTDDFVDAKVDGQLLHGRSGTFDITGVDDVEIVVKADGPTHLRRVRQTAGCASAAPRPGVRYRQAGQHVKQEVGMDTSPTTYSPSSPNKGTSPRCRKLHRVTTGSAPSWRRHAARAASVTVGRFRRTSPPRAARAA